MAPGDYRVRVSARGRGPARDLVVGLDDGLDDVHVDPDEYLVQLWLAARRPDRVLRVTTADPPTTTEQASAQARMLQQEQFPLPSAACSFMIEKPTPPVVIDRARWSAPPEE